MWLYFYKRATGCLAMRASQSEQQHVANRKR